MVFHFIFDTRPEVSVEHLGNFTDLKSSNLTLHDARLTAQKSAEVLGAKSFSIESETGQVLEIWTMTDGGWRQRTTNSGDETAGNPKGHVVCSIPGRNSEHTFYFSEEEAIEIERRCAQAGGTPNRIPY